MSVQVHSSPAASALLSPAAAFEAGDGRVGGKALGLARLARAGANVPWWVVLPVGAFERHLAQAGLDGLVRDTLATLTPEGVEAASESIGEAIRRAPVDPELASGIADAIDGRGPFAVRSSVVGEDSATHSFAGMFDSYLFLDDADQVVAAIKSCWASAFNARALAYVLNRGEVPSPPAVAVIVQEAVEGEASGVLFTSNPVSGRPDELLVSSCWGLGEGIVSGLCSTDELVWSHDGRELAVTIADKDVQVLPDPAGRGTLEAPVASDRRGARSLSPDACMELGRQALAVADRLGAPQDIEWTLRGDELFLLQTRPITSTTAPGPLGARRIAWDNSNIQESFNGVTSPLTFSIAVRGYERVHRQTLRILGVSEQTLSDYEPVLRNMIGLVSGRVYYNINNWYRVLLLLPSFDKKKEDLEHMIGVEEPVDFIEGTTLTAAEKLRRLPRLLRVGARLTWRFHRRERSIERFLSDFATTTGEIDRDHVAQADLGELLGWSQRLTGMAEDFAVPTVNDIYLMMTTGRLRKLVARAAGEQASDVVAGLISGEEAIESKEPTRRLIELAQVIRSDSELGALLAGGTPEEALAALRERSQVVRAALEEYIERYGDRCMGEQKLETISLRQDPSFLVKILRNFVAQPGLDAESLERHEQERREAGEQVLMESLGWWRRRRLRRGLANARSAVKAREHALHAHTDCGLHARRLQREGPAPSRGRPARRSQGRLLPHRRRADGLRRGDRGQHRPRRARAPAQGGVRRLRAG